MPPTIPDAAGPDLGRWVMALRPTKNAVDPTRPHAFFVEPERSETGAVEDTATLFLVNRECPFKCLMCDLWRNTTDRRVPDGAIVAQVKYALSRLPPAPHVKLYNAGNFFDAQAVPPGDLPRLAELLAPFRTAVVECHPKLIGPRCLEFRDRLRPAMRVAMGLETAHPDVLRRLNKGMTLEDFARAATFLSAQWRRRARFPATAAAVPRRGRGGRVGQAVAPICLRCRRRVLRGHPDARRQRGDGTAAGGGLVGASTNRVTGGSAGIRRRPAAGRVFADLWDIEKLLHCPRCGPARACRLNAMNREQAAAPPVVCDCGGPS